jgi:mono/diheme cytochrome c family protein
MTSHRLVPALALVCACAPPPIATAVVPRTIADPPANPYPSAQEPAPELAAREHPAPPMSGGTLTLSPDGSIAIASDPERDRVWIVGTHPARILREVVLEPGDEPGRSAIDAHGRAHVVLRGGGAIVSLTATGDDLERRRACPAPRGIASDGDRVFVACAGGELVTFDGDRIAARRLAPDLRDVGVHPDGSLWVTRFRTAEMMRVSVISDAVATARIETENVRVYNAAYGAAVAWRTLPDGHGGQWMLHQRHRKAELVSYPLHYYSAESAALFGAITHFEDGVPQHSTQMASVTSVLPLDAAVIDDTHLAVVAGGHGSIDLVDIHTGAVSNGPLSEHAGRAVAVAYHANVGVVVQYRDGAAIEIFAHPRQVGGEAYVALGPPIAPDRGFELFHNATQRGVACASCHPEGGDDGHVWLLPNVGARRTQPLGGGILAGAPYHWNGELSSFEALMRNVFELRMGGDPLPAQDVEAIGAWIDGLPDPERPSLRDNESIARGRAIFDGSAGCASCHSGARLTDGRSHDVGTGGELQTPSLRGLALRAPYLHDGRASSIEERLRADHTERHGTVSHLDDRGIEDLSAYLASL